MIKHSCVVWVFFNHSCQVVVWAFEVPPGPQLGAAYFLLVAFVCSHPTFECYILYIYTYMLNALFTMYFSVIDLFSLLNNTLINAFLLIFVQWSAHTKFDFTAIIAIVCLYAVEVHCLYIVRAALRMYGFLIGLTPPHAILCKDFRIPCGLWYAHRDV